MKKTLLDTFAGAGGFSLGFQMTNHFDVIGAIEIDEWAAETFQYNHPHAKVVVKDICTLSDEEIILYFGTTKPYIILGGPPCQGFSIANKKAGDPKDPRNSLFKEFIRIGRLLSPEIMILENVPNLIKARTSDKELVIDIIINELKQLGYYVAYKILAATDYGVPQIRKRLVVIASKQKIDNPFPNPTHIIVHENHISNGLIPCPSLWDAISDLPEIGACEGEYEMQYTKPTQNDFQNSMRNGATILYNHTAMKHSRRMVERFQAMSWGESVADVPHHLKPYKRNGNGEISENTYDQNNRRLFPFRPCHTIAASFYANFVHPYQNRNFTPREGARIQTFPDTYIFKGKPTVVSQNLLQREGRISDKHLGQYNQIGNAVPPLMAKAIANHIINQFKL